MDSTGCKIHLVAFPAQTRRLIPTRQTRPYFRVATGPQMQIMDVILRTTRTLASRYRVVFLTTQPLRQSATSSATLVIRGETVCCSSLTRTVLVPALWQTGKRRLSTSTLGQCRPGTITLTLMVVLVLTAK